MPTEDPRTDVLVPEMVEHVTLQILDFHAYGPPDLERLRGGGYDDGNTELADPVEFRHGYLVLSVVPN